MNRILIAEDEPRVSSFLAKGLQAAGFETTVVANGLEAERLARDGHYDLVLLDIGLPGQDGFEVLRALRRRGERLPVVVLTARDAVESTVSGFEDGADDYMTKPFAFEELLARVKARLRGRPGPGQTLRGVGIELDLLNRRARTERGDVPLTAREFKLLETFLRHPGEVLGREQLLSLVWGDDYDPSSNIVDVYVGYLRRKLGAGIISTARGVGYRVDAEAAANHETVAG